MQLLLPVVQDTLMNKDIYPTLILPQPTVIHCVHTSFPTGVIHKRLKFW